MTAHRRQAILAATAAPAPARPREDHLRQVIARAEEVLRALGPLTRDEANLFRARLRRLARRWTRAANKAAMARQGAGILMPG